ncbi:IMPG2 [Branchiostoma lanceolatum]|uniref:IMPG2 protein n=1 Tax=Branchiostoma lanceolatum TaxID=7740 RepID=A0A8J9Z6K8_BRALA|nr:IMPG2 [Branchiostoma lanceolatum]
MDNKIISSFIVLAILYGKPEKILAFSLSLNGDATGLNDTTSIAYKSLEQSCLTALRPVYDTQRGFKQIRILGFQSGSIIVRHLVIFDSEDAATNDEIMSAVENTVLNGNFSIAGYGVLPDSFASITLTTEEIAELGVDGLCTAGCGADALCNLTTIYGVLVAQCVCADDYCKNGGQCEVIPEQGPKCSCAATPFGYYGGARCEVYASQIAVIGVGAGVGGALLLIIIILVACLCCSRRISKDDIESLGKNIYAHPNEYGQQNSDSPQNNLARASRLTGSEFNYLKGELTTFQEGDEHNPNRQWNPTMENVPTKREFKLPRPKVSSGEWDQNRSSAQY